MTNPRFIIFLQITCLSLTFSILSASTESNDYDWAYQLREEIQTIPSYTEVADEGGNEEIDAKTTTTEAGPWGSPQNLLNPLPTESSTNKERQRRKGSTASSGSSGGSSSNHNSITVNINKDETLEDSNILDEQQRSRLEELYSGQFDRNANRDLVQFGYSIFESHTALATTTGPTPRNYIIGAGDQIQITLSGSLEAFHQITVNHDGVLNIPDFGSVAVAGTSYGELHQKILHFLEKRRHNFELSISLGKRRSIQVNVVGRVEKPGLIEVPAMSNLIQALAEAGGISKDGSLRSITLTRVGKDGESKQTIDLYDYLRAGASNNEFPQLQEQDVLFIPSIGPTVGIAGYVQEPGIYEFKSKLFSVSNALEIAGGLTPFSFTPMAQIERTVDGRGRQKVDIQLDTNGLKELMADGELLMIEAVDDRRQPIVRIEGEVARPGDYQYIPGMTLSDLVARADGLTVNAYLEQAFISRQIGPKSEIETVPGRSSHMQSKRVIVALLERALSRESEYDVELMPLDLITIRSQEVAIIKPVVEIIGSVQRPGKYELTAEMRVSDLIAIAGNLTPEVYYDEAELIRKEFDTQDLKLDVKRYRFNLQQALAVRHHYNNSLNPILRNGDQLIIRALQNAQVRVKIGGRVRFPGEYVFPDGAKITDLIKAAGGILDDADLRASVFTRSSTRKLQQSRLDDLVERTRRLAESALERMVQTGKSKEGFAAKIALEQTKAMLERVGNKNANGRIVIPFEYPQFPSSAYNLPLQTGDSLTIPRSHPTVSVSGDVFRPITFIVLDGVTVQDALEKAGGLTEMADDKLLYIIRANGEIERSKKSKGFIKKKTMLYAGDVLLAPTQPMKRTLGAQFSDLVMLTRQIAEIAVITSNGGGDFDISLVSPFTPEKSGIGASVDAATFLND